MDNRGLTWTENRLRGLSGLRGLRNTLVYAKNKFFFNQI